MASFFIDTDTGQVATLSQLTEAGAVGPNALPTPPWYPIQGTRDATTLWYAVMRKQVRHKHIGALCIRHSDHHASLLEKGWRKVLVEEIRTGSATRYTPARATGPAGKFARRR